MDNSNKKISWQLIVGIILMPVVFSWFTLKASYSKMTRGLAFGWLIVTIIIFASSYEQSEIQRTQKPAKLDTSQAQEYRVLKHYYYPTPPDKAGRETYIYAPTAQTFEQRAHTVIKAAYTMLEQDNLHEIVIRLSALPTTEPKYLQIGRAEYHPNKTNTWGTEQKYIWRVDSNIYEIVNGQIEEDGKQYPLDSITIGNRSYLKQ